MKRTLLVLFLWCCTRVVCAGPLANHSDEGVPAFAVTAPNGRQSLLIGVMHVPAKGLLRPSPEVLAGKRHFVIEHMGETSPAELGVPQAVTTKPGAPAAWAAGLSAAELDTYHRRAACSGKTPEQADELLTHPEVRDANQVAYAVCGLNQFQAADFALTLSAMLDYHLKPEYLEDDAFVQRQRLAVPEGIERRGFRWALSHDPAAVLAPVAGAFNAGDFDAIQRLVDGSFANSTDAATHRHIMVDERNAAWMGRLRGYLDDGDAAIVVGALHLPGPHGLVARLRADGYAVDLVRVPALP
ncbi:TraB/GumN family protein [Burkholderia cepacia]|uniref:TraB/GumN family protein n=1 Tax=Burkholderia cepacia TaxID=292 RepID=UPI0026E070CF|nr:TraB/GumN family protein [Burkholderia cepacia]MDO5947190.1 TraB/GumN family protein [Burkholderia cepacia]